MVKHTQTILWQKPTKLLSVFDDFVGLSLKLVNPLTRQSYVISLLEKLKACLYKIQQLFITVIQYTKTEYL